MYHHTMDTTVEQVCPHGAREVRTSTMETVCEREQVSPFSAGNSEEKEPEVENGSSMRNPFVAEIVLLNTLGYLDTIDIIRASKVCRLWHSISSRKIFWIEIRTKKLRIVNIERMVDTIKRQGTRKLDLQETIFPEYSRHSHPHFWLKLFYHLKSAKTIINLVLGRCPPFITQLVRLGNLKKTVKYLNILLVSGSGLLLDLSQLESMNLTRLEISSSDPNIAVINAHLLSSMESLEMFALSSWSPSGTATPFGVGRVLLKDLPLRIVPAMVNLRKLRLRDRTSIFISDELISAISRLEHLRELELINCTVSRHFQAGLAKCTRLKGLSISVAKFNPRISIDIPINIHQHVIAAAYSLRNNLDYFSLGIYEENMRETKEYVKTELDSISFVRYVQEDEALAVPFLKRCKCEKKPCDYKYHFDFILFKSLRVYLTDTFGKCRTELIKLKMPHHTMNTKDQQVCPVESPDLEEEEPEVENGSSMRNPFVAEIVLLNTLGYFDTIDIIRASKVCRLWHSISSRKIFWIEIRTKKLRIVNIERMVDTIKRQGTRKLDLRETIFPLHFDPSHPHFWLELFYQLKSAKTIINLDLGICSPIVTHLIRLGNLRNTIKYLKMTFKCDSGRSVDFSLLKSMKLIKLEISFLCSKLRFKNPHCLSSIQSLEMFALTTYTPFKSISPNGIAPLDDLLLQIVPGMVNLRKLVLHDLKTILISCNFISAISRLEHLRELELINCTVLSSYFKNGLAKCTRLKSLTISPTIFNPLSTHHTVINIHQSIIVAAWTLRDTLDCFKLGIYEKYLRETKEFIKNEMDNGSCKVSYAQSDEVLAIPFAGECTCIKNPCRYQCHIDFLDFNALRVYLSGIFGKCRTELLTVRDFTYFISDR